jgi:hypothetical protein
MIVNTSVVVLICFMLLHLPTNVVSQLNWSTNLHIFEHNYNNVYECGVVNPGDIVSCGIFNYYFYDSYWIIEAAWQPSPYEWKITSQINSRHQIVGQSFFTCYQILVTNGYPSEIGCLGFKQCNYYNNSIIIN